MYSSIYEVQQIPEMEIPFNVIFGNAMLMIIDYSSSKYADQIAMR